MNCRTLTTIAGVLLPAVAWGADKQEVEYDAFQLAAGSIPVNSGSVQQHAKSHAVVIQSGNCKLSLEAAQIKRGDTCNDLWTKPNPETIVLTDKALDIELTLTPRKVAVGTAVIQETITEKLSEWSPSSMPANGEVVLFVDNTWRSLKAQKDSSGRAVLDVQVLKLAANNNYRGYANFDKNGASGYAQLELAVTPKKDDAPRSNPAAPRLGSGANDYCVADKDGPKYLVCVDLVDNNVEFRAVGDDSAAKHFIRNHIMLPNSGLLVVVRHDSNNDVKMALGGNRGLFVSKIVNPVDGVAHAASPKEAQQATVSKRSFGPRLPGAVELTVTESKDKTEVRQETIELVVEETHAGAFRLGIASVFGNAVDRSYATRSVEGATQKEVAATGASKVDFELVLGTAPYLFDYLFLGGPRPAITSGPRFAPYFGVGLLTVKPDQSGELAFLKSMHFGCELELVPGFSVAGTAVVRRVTRLSGTHIGAPANDEVSTVAKTGVGGALIVNFSPEFFKIAGKGSGGLL